MVLLFLLIIFLFPVAIYCSILAGINRRTKPLMVSGVWDCVGLLFASSGFLLVAGPAILSALFDNDIKPMLLRGGRTVLPVWIGSVLGNWGFYWLFYYGGIIIGSFFLLRARLRNTIIYNIDSIVFEHLLSNLLGESRFYWNRQGKKIFVNYHRTVPEELELTENKTAITVEKRKLSSNQVPLDSLDESSYLEIDEFPGACNVTLSWHGEALNFRFEIESELQNKLEAVYTEENPAGTWLLGISGAIFLLMILGMLMVIVSFLFSR